MSVVLVVNSGSSSIKYQIIEMDTETVLAKGLVERVGSDHGHSVHTGPDGTHERDLAVPDHDVAFQAMMDACAEYGPNLTETHLTVVGHRVVQGGARYIKPTLIDDEVERNIDDLSALAPLHNPANLRGIVAARREFPDIPHIAIFDTAFHQTMSPDAYTYAINTDLAQQYQIRKYGFHGTSHKFVSQGAAEFLNRPLAEVNSIVLHIGNGASACAVRGGISVETSMGMTPLEGLVMGTRSGDIDPAVLMYLHRRAEMSVDELDELLNRKSGLLGLAGTRDVRDVQQAAESGDARAKAALAIYCHRIRHYVGAYYAQLGRLDAIVYTAGVGENSSEIRAQSLTGLEHMGIKIDPVQNQVTSHERRRVSSDESRVSVLVIPTNEELEIARQAIDAIS